MMSRMNGTETQLYNRTLVLATLRNCSGRSRAGIARVTGLSTTAAANIVNDLISDGMVRETDDAEQQERGRKGRVVSLNPGYTLAVGVEVTDRYLHAVLVDFTEQPVHSISFDMHENDAAGVLQAIVDATNSLRTYAANTAPVCGACLAVQGVSLRFPISRGWKPGSLAQAVSEQVNIPVHPEVRMLAATTAELRYGVGRKCKNFVYFNSAAGSGFGIGIVSGGKILRGVSGFSGQLGHLCVQPGGQQCYCGGRGCLATIAAPDAIVAGIKQAVNSGVETSLASIDPEVLRFSHLVEAAKNGDRLSIYTLDTVGEALGLGFSYVINLLNPEAIVLSGVLAEAGDQLLQPIIRSTRLHSVAALYKQVAFTVSELDQYAGARGAASHLLDQYFAYGSEKTGWLENTQQVMA